MYTINMNSYEPDFCYNDSYLLGVNKPSPNSRYENAARERNRWLLKEKSYLL